MTRIRHGIFWAAVSVVCGVCIESASQAQEGDQSTSKAQDSDAGVEAVYCFNVSIPSMDQTGVIYVTYLVTKNDWAAHMDWDIGFINGMFAPPLVSTSIHATDKKVEFYSPYMNQRSEFVFGDRNVRNRYNSQMYPLTELVHSFDEARVWRIPETVEQQIAAIDPNRIEFVEIPYTVRNLAGKFDCSLVVNSVAGKVTEIRQSPLQDWERTHSGFQEFETHGGRQTAATECRISDLGDRFGKFNEFPEKSILGDHPRHSDAGLLFHRGGRHIRTSWKQINDVVVPENMTVTLGPTGSGMLLRGARLLSARQVPEVEIRQQIEKLRVRTSADAVVANLGKAVGRQFWKVSPQQLDNGMKLSADQFKAEYASLLAQQLSVGDRVGLLRGRILLFAATVDTSNVVEFERVLTEYVDFLGQSAGLEGQMSLLFDLLEMLRSWERPDLEEVAIQEATRIMEQQSPDRQIRVLFFARGATETSDIYTHQLLNAISRSLRVNDVPESLIRSALVVASLRLQNTCNGILSDSSDRTIKDATRRSQLRIQLVTAYLGLLDELQSTKSEELQQSSIRLRRLVEILQTESEK